MINIPDIQPDPLVPLNILPAMHLGPAGDPGSDLKHSQFFPGILIYRPGMIGKRGAGADKAHIALKDIDSLRQLIDGCSAQDPSNPCYPGVIAVTVNTGPCVLRIHCHGTEFIHAEFPAVLPQSSLPENYRAS